MRIGILVRNGSVESQHFGSELKAAFGRRQRSRAWRTKRWSGLVNAAALAERSGDGNCSPSI